MSLEMLKANIKREKELTLRLKELIYQYDNYSPKDKAVIDQAISSIKNQIRILNDSVPKLAENVNMLKKLNQDTEPIKHVEGIVNVSYNEDFSSNVVAINKKDKPRYLRELNISQTAFKSLKKKRKPIEVFENEFQKPNFYVVLSSRMFGKISNSLVTKYGFNGLRKSLKRGNFKMLVNSYVSIMLFTSMISFFIGIFASLFFILLSVSLTPPYLVVNEDFFVKTVQFIWLMFLFPIATFLTMYIYPSLERSSIEGGVDYELPFVTIQMAAIAGADIEPSNIFKIIALNKEYPFVRQEAKKLMNQLNLYGYDLVTALRNVAMASPSKSWAELLNGFSTTIRSGGDLSKYLHKRAETLLFEYRLKREKATKSAETFMNLYISIVIAAPMLLMLLLIMLNISQIGFSLPVPILTLIVVSIVALINLIFLVFLKINQKRV